MTRTSAVVLLGLVCLIASVAGPAIFHARETARQVKCWSNLRGIGLAWINASHYEQSESIPLTGPLLKFNDAGDEVNGVAFRRLANFVASVFRPIGAHEANTDGRDLSRIP